MSGGEALDLALGLLRAPARRGALAARPLPTGMTTLLEVAGGSEAAAKAAAASTGATPAELLEASRFFVQQILFTEDASAYRVLGAGPDAPQSTLQAHHRHLQRWLHPDRDGGEAWDSAFSARVNDAWNQLRTPKARRAYDQSRPEHAVPRAPTTATAATATAEWPARPAASASSWHPPSSIALTEEPLPRPNPFRRFAGPLAVLVLGLACVWLLWMEQQRDGRAQADLFPPQSESAPPIAALASPPDVPAVVDVAVSSDAVVAPVGRPYAADASDAGIRGERGGITVAERRGRSPDLRNPPAPVSANIAAPAEPDVPATPSVPAAPDVPAIADDPARPAATDFTEPDPFLLFQQAEHTAAQATAYLASDGSHIPPIWNDFPTEAAAAATRARLAVRLDGRDPRDISLGSPQWRMDGKRAVLDAGYSIGGWRTRESGALRIEMSRREQRWLVTHLTLEPSA